MREHPLLELKNVGLAYHEGRLRLFNRNLFWVLKDVSFTLYKGETLGIVGRNGAGKSTLLRLLAGIYRQDRGTVVRHGARASLLSLNAGFSQDLTGRENAILSGILLGMRKRDIEAKLDEILEFSELGNFFDEPLMTYSSGMRARLGFSVAFQIKPEIMLIDEVLGVGDENFRLKSSAAMRHRMRNGGTVILVSHSAATIKDLCDRAVWLNDGVTQIEGDVQPVLDAYHEHEKSLRESGATLREMSH